MQNNIQVYVNLETNNSRLYVNCNPLIWLAYDWFRINWHTHTTTKQNCTQPSLVTALLHRLTRTHKKTQTCPLVIRVQISSTSPQLPPTHTVRSDQNISTNHFTRSSRRAREPIDARAPILTRQLQSQRARAPIVARLGFRRQIRRGRRHLIRRRNLIAAR